jgi:hypothetical protein
MDPYLGEIRLVGFGFPIKGWALCNGQLLPINQNQALFALLGTCMAATAGSRSPCPTCADACRCMALAPRAPPAARPA